MKHIRTALAPPIRTYGRQRLAVRSRFALACLTGALACAGVTPAHAVSGHCEDCEGIVFGPAESPVRIYCNTDAGFQPPPPPLAGPQKLTPPCHQKSSDFFPNDEGLAVFLPEESSANHPIVLNRGQTLVENATISAQTIGQFTVSNDGALATATPVFDSGDLVIPPPHAVSLICATFDSPESPAERHCVKVIEDPDVELSNPDSCGGLQVEANNCADEIADLGEAFSAPKANWILEIPDPSEVGKPGSETVKVCTADPEVVNASWECADTQDLEISGSVQGQGPTSVVFTPHCILNVCY